MNGPAMLADHLDARTDAILALWRSTVENRGDVPESEKLSPLEFNDHIPELLDRLAERLRGGSGEPHVEAQKHGRVRWRQGYGAGEIISELGHLRTVLNRATFAYAHQNRFDLETLETILGVINDVLNGATAEAVSHFQELSSKETEAALAEVENRQAAVEEARRTAEADRSKLRTLLDNLPVGVWVAAADGTIVDANREAERLQGFRQEQKAGLVNVFDHSSHYRLSRPDGTAYRAGEVPIARALRGESVVQEEIIWQLGDERRVITTSAAPLTDPAGGIVGGIVVAENITGRKLVEGQLRRQLDFTRAITDNMGEGLCAVDREGRLTFMNPAAERMFGWSEAELLGREIHQTIHYQRPDGSPYPVDECPLMGVIRTGKSLRCEDTFTRRDGTMFPVSLTSSPTVSGGQMVGAVLTFHDITESKRLEASLAASEARFRSIAEQSPVIIWRSDLNGRCDYVNRTYLEFRGRTLEDVLRDGWFEGAHPDDRERFLSAYQEALLRHEPFEIEYRILRHDGQFRWVTDRGAPYHDAHGAFLGHLGSCLDITERIELHKALEQQRELAEESSNHKTRLLSALSHDARTPLNAVGLAAELLEMHCRGLGNAEVDECLRTIRNSVRNVLDLLGDLLNLTKIDAGVLPPVVTRFALEPVLAESLSSIETQARLKGLDVRIEPGELAGLTVETDRSKLKQVLCNLLSNALRYTDGGFIRILGARSEDQIQVSVQDTGLGIDPGDQQRIFDEFATLNNPHRPPGEGTGLGLAICRRLANLLKGEIRLESAPGQGSTFTLVLPASVVTSALPENPVASDNGPTSGLILVAEDHLSSRQTLAKVLRKMGYRVKEAGNGHDVLALVRQERPLAILMDINMPVMSGIEATLALRADALWRDIPIFALTGDVSVINQRRIGEAGVNGYLEKPVTWEVLKQAIGSLQR
jgi:PAS domain S-box-containing protein